MQWVTVAIACYFLRLRVENLTESVSSISGSGLKAKLENLMIQLQKNCNHLDLLESQFNQSCKGFVILMMGKCSTGNLHMEYGLIEFKLGHVTLYGK
jgi:hypothetical protein